MTTYCHCRDRVVNNDADTRPYKLNDYADIQFLQGVLK